MDVRTLPGWARLALTFALFGGVGTLLLFGGAALGFADPRVARHWLERFDGAWALPAAIACFAVLAFVGAPQFVLIAAAAAVFGPWRGLAYSWVGTMVSALVGFGLGRWWGPSLGPKTTDGAVGRFVILVGRNGFLASLVIRLVPFAPFVVVNMAAGLSSIALIDFSLGTAIGIIPKIAVTALAGGSIGRVMGGGASGPLMALALAALGVWALAGLIARRWLRR